MKAKCTDCGGECSPKAKRCGPCYDKRRAHKVEVRVCPICGDKWKTNWATKLRQTCGKDDCAKTLSKQRIIEVQGRDLRTCKQCGKRYKPKRPGTEFCGRICAYAFRAEKKLTRICTECGSEFNTGAHNVTLCKDCRRTAHRKYAHVRRCKICGRHHVTVRSQEYAEQLPSLCGRKRCRVAYEAKRAQSRARAKHNARAKECRCVVCGALFCPLYGNKHRNLCGSDECSQEHRRRQRRHEGKTLNARARSKLRVAYGLQWTDYYESINRVKVLRRDHWTCQRCGSKLNRKTIKPFDDNNPTVDHIVPLSAGGPHLYSNVRACCAKCNSQKSGAIESWQLRLV